MSDPPWDETWSTTMAGIFPGSKPWETLPGSSETWSLSSSISWAWSPSSWLTSNGTACSLPSSSSSELRLSWSDFAAYSASIITVWSDWLYIIYFDRLQLLLLLQLTAIIVLKELLKCLKIRWLCESFLYLGNCTVLGIKFYHAKVVLLVIWNRWFVKILEFKCGRFLSSLV